MRNIVILKDLPSNLVEEAFVVFKENQKIKNPQYIENKFEKFSHNFERSNENEYVIKEAEFLISDYINKIEKQDLSEIKNESLIIKKYKKLKIFSIILSISLVVSFICIIN